MNGPAHIVVGVGMLYLSNTAFHIVSTQPVAIGLAAGAVIIGALLPDIDQNNSTIRQKTGTARGAGPLGCLGWVGGIGAAILGGHRGFTHTLVALLFVSFLALQWTPESWRYVAWAGLLGYGSHLLADMMTEGGIPLFWPLTSKRIGVWR